MTTKKLIKTINSTLLNDESRVAHTGCGECQASCQSACKTSCTVANQPCEAEIREEKSEIK
ncbi:MAG: six-cysteine ranthipeptide SCIFF [Defluviitaleaceae bacterium]|nr:six-cysteine ranthipeptide SCIFF [Defluviitaleaceae bacterium]